MLLPRIVTSGHHPQIGWVRNNLGGNTETETVTNAEYMIDVVFTAAREMMVFDQVRGLFIDAISEVRHFVSIFTELTDLGIWITSKLLVPA
jgi:hypothetical protein